MGKLIVTENHMPKKTKKSKSLILLNGRRNIDKLEDCPLCISPFDETERNFWPCICRYQICLFCYDHLKRQSNLCPGCRQMYKNQSSRMLFKYEKNLDCTEVISYNIEKKESTVGNPVPYIIKENREVNEKIVSGLKQQNNIKQRYKNTSIMIMRVLILNYGLEGERFCKLANSLENILFESLSTY